MGESIRIPLVPSYGKSERRRSVTGAHLGNGPRHGKPCYHFTLQKLLVASLTGVSWLTVTYKRLHHRIDEKTRNGVSEQNGERTRRRQSLANTNEQTSSDSATECDELYVAGFQSVCFVNTMILHPILVSSKDIPSLDISKLLSGCDITIHDRTLADHRALALDEVLLPLGIGQAKVLEVGSVCLVHGDSSSRGSLPRCIERREEQQTNRRKRESRFS